MESINFSEDGKSPTLLRQPIQTSKSHRFLGRSNAKHRQSPGKYALRRKKIAISLKVHDWFHTLVYLSTWKLVVIFALVQVASWLIIAGLLELCTVSCDLGLHNFNEALMLAIMLMSTIGMGERGDPYENGCSSGLAVVSFTVLWGLLIDAVTIGVVYTRISRGQNRATTVMFSDKAIIRNINNKFYFMFQVCEMRKHQLIEGHVRLYCIRHSQTAGPLVPFQSHSMRLQQPDDELGGMLLLVTPQQVVHRIDAWSPLHSSDKYTNASTGYQFPDVLQRQSDIESGNRDARGAALVGTPAMSLDAISTLMADTDAEVLALVEGIDQATSFTVQARHSYKLEDIEFGDVTFKQCVSVGTDGVCEINFEAFHEVTKNGVYEDAPFFPNSHS
eukprot:m.47964 g.47964  ORF g.47964 m.47964 type:complete len:389 (-) comp20630_c0_seq1:198-1364(-)